METSKVNDTHEGGCLCGAIRYAVQGKPFSTAHCHCRSCQRALGAAFATWCGAKAEDFKVTKGEIKTCETSPGVFRGFCGNCGTSLTYATGDAAAGQDWGGKIWFLAATLDDPSTVTPTAHVYVSHRQPWVKLDDGLPESPEF